MIFSLLLFLPRACFAMTQAEFDHSALKLKESQSRTDRMLTVMGANSAFEGSHSALPSEKSDPSLFRVHDTFQDQKLALGKILFGRTLNRLVVAGDGSPLLVELDLGQSWLSGLRVMGDARQAGAPGRISFEMKQILLKGGKSIAVSGVGLDHSGAFGLEAQVFSQKAWAALGSIASSFMSGMASSQQSQSANAFGFSQSQPTGRNALLQGVAQSAADQSKRLIEEATQDRPVLVVEPETPVSILIQEAVR